MDFLRKAIYSLRRPRQVLRPIGRRYMMIPHAVICFSMAWGASFDRKSFSSPIFAPIFELAPLTLWGILFGVVGILAIYTALSASWVGYFASNTTLCGLSSLWFSALSYARFFADVDVSTPAFGLWLFVVSTCLILAASPTRVVQTH